MVHLIKYWFPVLLYAGLIFVSSSIRFPEAPVQVPHFDKIIHFFEYAILALLIYRACVNSPRASLYKNRISISVLGAVPYALLDELHQYFVPMREMSLFDFLADALGACCAIILVSLVAKHALKHNI